MRDVPRRERRKIERTVPARGIPARRLPEQTACGLQGCRKNDTLAQVTTDLSNDDMKVLGLYFEGKRVKGTSVPDAALAAVGK